MPYNNTLKKSPKSLKSLKSPKNIIDMLNSMNIFPEIITRLAKIGKIDKDTLNNLFLITYEHHKNNIEDFKNKIIHNQIVNKTDLKKLINEILLNQIHLKSSPKFQETIQKGGNKTMIKFADMIVHIISLFYLISTLFWVLVFITKASIMVLKPIEYSNDEQLETLRKKSFIYILLEISCSRFVYLFLSNIINKLSNMLNENGSSNEVVRNNDDDYDLDEDDEDNLRDLIIDITGYMGDLIEENNIIHLSVGKINRKKSYSRFKKLRKATMPYHDEKILKKEILEVKPQQPRVIAIQNYRDPDAIPSSQTTQANIPFSDQVYKVAYTDEQLANQVYDEIRVHLRNLNNPVIAEPIGIWRRGGTKKRVKKNRRNTKKSSTI